ncbi:uncharacterized protein LOC135482998 [Lineus longissimus]|uniref:uncharacterized protein LOC135482998 n=1 Tax=Lineus longissimus TaxID=88925 RepID=UPI00315C7179
MEFTNGPPTTTRPNMKCAVLNTKACRARPTATYRASKSGYYPGSPRDLKVDTYLKYNPADKILYPVVNISFKGPDDATLIFVKGFEVTLMIASGEHASWELAICRLFDLSAANITNDDVVTSSQIEFSYKGCFSLLRKKTTYRVRVRSLPEPTTINSPAKDVAVYIDTPVPTAPVIDSRNSANWAFFIQTVIDNNQLKVSFSKPPYKFKFTRFRVSLIRYTTNEEGEQIPKLVTEQEVQTSPVVFKVRCPGLYAVWVEPIDTYLLKKKKCLCKLDGQCASMCLISRTRSPINITTAGPSCPGANLPKTTSTASNTNVPDTGPLTLNILGVSISATCGLIVVFVLVFVFCRRRWKSGGDAPTLRPLIDSSKTHFNPDCCLRSRTINERTKQTGMPPSLYKSNPLSMLTVTNKTLLLLYHAGSLAHKNVVFLFANFLTCHCCMEFILHDRCAIEIGLKGKDNWVVEKFVAVDWIVIINSTGAFEQLRNNSDMIQTEAHILNDMFSCAITMLDRFSDKLKNNCISVYFPYTDKKKLIRQFTPKGIHYELTTKI